ncbi:conserved hypothetical protein [Roseibium sp. TrichSKD4]|uniref:hypothetical protein n=1 Tax=Roseibium sp. TrichSKD4 TaxID=744980 RepID=UPI0001E5632A|nr:hypothetical protein [Roseibium sp. TrichSKD4]EFO33882.1 conserved hypothetical protein [Roseibium sp. TrichSKD4]
MLYKDLISTYGSSLAGRSSPKDDPIWHFSRTDELRLFRENTLEALQQAKVYLLDHLAASYADTLHDDFLLQVKDTDVPSVVKLGAIELPAKVAWVEFDYGALASSRVDRDSPQNAGYEKPLGSGLCGYLIDDRDADHLSIIMFARESGSKLMDPTCRLRVIRAADGQPNFDDYLLDRVLHLLDYYKRLQYPEERIHANLGYFDSRTKQDLFIPFALFAMLVSPDLGGIIPTPTETLSAKEAKVARKFGKSWVTSAQKSHLTIRIGPQAISHMIEKQARIEFERQSREERAGPVRHWVSEHERHYRNGKVVLVKGHFRGDEPVSNLPTRVMGPKTG